MSERIPYRKSYEIVGWAYEAGVHCPSCAAKRFGAEVGVERASPVDRERNPVQPVFLGAADGEELCADCLRPLDV